MRRPRNELQLLLAATWLLSFAPVVAAETLSPAAIAKLHGPAVVMIEVEAGESRSQGSGVLLDPAGVVATNLHVVGSAQKIKVSLHDGRQVERVAVRAFDVERDLAVLVLDLEETPGGLAAARLGPVDGVEPGDAVVVISNPHGLSHSVTEGLVSAWREPDEPEANERVDLSDVRLLLPSCRMLQISAEIAPGSSGGPVFDGRGEVIGLVTSGLLYGASGQNFAVPGDRLVPLLQADDAMDLETFVSRVNRVRADLARPYVEDAEIDLERGDRQRAEHRLALALLRHPGHEGALLMLGQLRLDDGQAEAALELFGRALEANPDSAEVWFRAGTAYNFMGLDQNSASALAKARAAYGEALERDDRHAVAALRLAMLELGREAVGRAEELLLQAVEHDPALVDAHYLLGEIRFARGDREDAKEAFEQALWEDEQHARSHFGLAVVLMQEAGASASDVQHHWEEFLRLSEHDPSLAVERDKAVRFLEQHLPHLLD